MLTGQRRVALTPAPARTRAEEVLQATFRTGCTLGISIKPHLLLGVVDLERSRSRIRHMKIDKSKARRWALGFAPPSAGTTRRGNMQLGTLPCLVAQKMQLMEPGDDDWTRMAPTDVSWVANKRFEISKFKFKIPRARMFELYRAHSRLYRSQILPEFAQFCV